MKDIRSLEQTLTQHLSWHKARVKFVAAFILALVTAKTVNLVQLASVFAGAASQDSKYKKLQRLFRHFELPLADIADLVVKLLGVEGAWTLSLDRTNGVNRPLVIAEPRRMWGTEWYFSGCYLGKGEYLILVSPSLDESAVENYAKRWGIETLFCGAKNSRLLSGTNSHDRPSPVRKVAGLTGIDVLPVPQAGRVGTDRKGAQAQKTWQQTQIHLSIGL